MQEKEEEEKPALNIGALVSSCGNDPTFLLKTVQESSTVEQEQKDSVKIVLRSAKMGEMASLFTLSPKARVHKLNTSAIQLQLTAQSSLLSDRDHHVRGTSARGDGIRARSCSIGSGNEVKRSRRISGPGVKRVKVALEGEECT